MLSTYREHLLVPGVSRSTLKQQQRTAGSAKLASRLSGSRSGRVQVCMVSSDVVISPFISAVQEKVLPR